MKPKKIQISDEVADEITLQNLENVRTTILSIISSKKSNGNYDIGEEQEELFHIEKVIEYFKLSE